ncbi:probable fructose-2,6-bisphosphatase C732.02c [Camellia sinensis]|uniref:probable fructose-2,6-bisphosphatase C732.02c n=1 Tax=Camellia sinensis TaxID=4442 RepID=UPI0010357191|nr:probable fructose-2,6-bisphosphatase C732.02c [Camellia sinensis]
MKSIATQRILIEYFEFMESFDDVSIRGCDSGVFGAPVFALSASLQSFKIIDCSKLHDKFLTHFSHLEDEIGHLVGLAEPYLNIAILVELSKCLPGLSYIDMSKVNTHLTPRPILLTRHGESRDNVRGRIGSDSGLSLLALGLPIWSVDLITSLNGDTGEIYAKKLANFVEKRLKNERAASIWTSTLQRTILTAGSIVGFPKIQWRALKEINAGVCDGMTYEEIKKNMPEEYEYVAILYVMDFLLLLLLLLGEFSKDE